jgi:transcriptional regulator of acetoin/glycerol metabolism
MIEAGTFREDLYYRINGLVVTLPELSERTDLPALVTRILESQREGERLPVRVSEAVLEHFRRCRWPGNLRQLANVLRTAGIMAEGAQQIEIEHLPDDFLPDCDAAAGTQQAGPADAIAQPAACAGRQGSIGGQPAHETASRTQASPARMEDWQTTLIAQTLSRHGGNVSAAARELGLARNTVYRYLRRGRTH